MNDRPTPETDALDNELHNPQVLSDRYSAILDHSRGLERERDEAREHATNSYAKIGELDQALKASAELLCFFFAQSGITRKDLEERLKAAK